MTRVSEPCCNSVNIDNGWQLPNGAITVITEELAKHESRVLQPDISKAKCGLAS